MKVMPADLAAVLEPTGHTGEAGQRGPAASKGAPSSSAVTTAAAALRALCTPAMGSSTRASSAPP